MRKGCGDRKRSLLQPGGGYMGVHICKHLLNSVLMIFALCYTVSKKMLNWGESSSMTGICPAEKGSRGE